MSFFRNDNAIDEPCHMYKIRWKKTKVKKKTITKSDDKIKREEQTTKQNKKNVIDSNFCNVINNFITVPNDK